MSGTNTIIDISFPLSAADGGTGLAILTSHGILIGEGTSNINPIVLSAGQILAGTTSSDPAATTIGSGTGINVTSGSGSISVALSTPVSTTNGGTGVSNPTAHGVMVAEGSSAVTPIVLGAGQILVGTTSSDPSAATIGSGTGITVTSSTGAVSVALSTPVSATNGGTGAASPTAHGIMIAEGSSAMTSLVLGAGQLPIGTTSGDPSAAGLTATDNSITINSSSGAISVGVSIPTIVVSTSINLVSNTSYIMNGASLVTATLPAIAAVGTFINIIGRSASGWKIAQNSGQTINGCSINGTSTQATTTGTGGSLASANHFQCVNLICLTANTLWGVTTSQGALAFT